MKRIKREEMMEVQVHSDAEFNQGIECSCGYTYFTKECPRCSIKRDRDSSDEPEVMDKFGDNIFIPLKGNFDFVDTCDIESHARCKECDVDNCTKSRRYKLRLAYLKYHGQA